LIQNSQNNYIMSLKLQIDADIKKAMLARSQDELKALRAIKSLILLAETEKGAKEELTQEAEMKLLTKASKQRKESAEIYQQQNRQDLATIEIAELEVISRYLPQQMSEDEIKVEIAKVIAAVGATGPQDMGKVMGAANKVLAGKADGKSISETVKALLSK
jgi:uncharacterized protein YqeY